MSDQSWTENLLVYAHIGDLHITEAGRQNYRDFLLAAAQIETHCSKLIDFVYLPGDNADNGKLSQYDLIATGLKMLSAPVHVISGDHDMEPHSLDALRARLTRRELPYSEWIRGIRCIFADMCGAGAGGPDFRFGAEQLAFLAAEIGAAERSRERVAVFAHTYPADLAASRERNAYNRLLQSPAVLLSDMGHTHYNELANDGSTIFAATRSTGQIEEGPVGYSLTAIDGHRVSWRFKLLDDPFPFVMITAPADRRLATRLEDTGQIGVHAIVFGARPIPECRCRIGDGEWRLMRRTADGRGWETSLDAVDRDVFRLTVRATDSTGRPGEDTIEAARYLATQTRHAQGSDLDSIGAWPEKHIFATQLGPNRNGKPTS